MTMHVPILWREGFDPFAGRPQLRRLPVVDRAPTVAEIVAGIDDLPSWFWLAGVVCIDGVAVPREMWAFVRPQPSRDGREVVVSLHTPLQGGGGGGGGKSAWATVAAIAVVAATLWVGGGGLAALGPAFAAGKIGATIAAASISIAGQLAVAALTPAPSFDDQSGSGADVDTSRTASLSGNVLRPGAPVPRVIGTHRVLPPLATQVLTDLVDGDDVVEATFVLAGPHAISDVHVDDVPVAQIDDVDVQINEGFGPAEGMTLIRRYGVTQQPGVTLDAHKTDEDNTDELADQTDPESCIPGWTTHLVRGGPDEIWLDLVWPQGLFYMSSSGGAETCFVPVRLRMRPRGGTDSDWRNLPELQFQNGRTVSYRKSIRIRWAPQGDVATPPKNGGPVRAYTSVPQSNYGLGGGDPRGGWTAHSWFYSGAGVQYLAYSNPTTSGVRNVDLTKYIATLYVGGPDFPAGLDWEIQIIRGYPVVYANWVISTYQYGSTVSTRYIYDLFSFFNASSAWRIIPILSKYQYLATLARVAAVWNDVPLTGTDFAVLQLVARGRSISRVSALASGYVRDWSGSAWSTWTTTSNPAPHYRDVLAGDLAARQMPEEIIDDDALVDWRQHCIDHGHAVNAVVEGRSAPEALSLIAAAGYARPRQSETVGVIIDRDRAAESPVQHFSPRTTRGMTFEKAFATLPDGLRVRFRDATSDYDDTEIIVMAPWSSADTSSLLLEEIAYDGITSEAAARARALFDLAQMRDRMTFYAFDAPAAALVCRRGDLVGVTSDVIDQSVGAARIKAITWDGSDVIALTLDGTVPTPREDAWTDITAAWSGYGDAWAPPRHGLAITYTDGTSAVVEVTAPAGVDESATLALVDPLPDPGTVATPAGTQARLQADCHVVAGPLGAETRRMIVHTIAPKSATEFSLRLVDEAPQLWA